MASVSGNGMAFCSPTSQTITKKKFRVKVEAAPVDELIRMKSFLPNSCIREFRSKYGEILELLNVPVQEEGIAAMVQYWDNELRCFTLPEFHLSLVVEEYASFLKRPLNQNDTVYTYPGVFPSHRAVAQLLGKTVEETTLIKQGQTQALRLGDLIKHMEGLVVKRKWDMFSRVLALTVYGIVLFPFAVGSVDLAAVSIFMAVEYHRVNPVPAILADTYISLSYCQQREGGKLKCCLQLLTVWMGNHIFGRKWSKEVRFETIHHPLRDFQHREGSIMKDPQRQEELASNDFPSWVEFLKQLSRDKIRWKLVWWDQNEVLYSCGEFQNVPLVGPRGGINYNPSLAHLQLAYSQSLPMKELIQPVFFMHGIESTTLNAKITRAWKDMRFKGKVELGPRMIKAAPEYIEWVSQKSVVTIIPTETYKNPLLGNDTREIENALKFKIEEHKIELENLEMVKKRRRREILRSQEEYVELRKDIDELQRSRQLQNAEAVKNIQARIEGLKKEIREMQQAHHRRESELHKETEIYRKKYIELQSINQALLRKDIQLERRTEKVEEELLTQSQQIASLQAENDRILYEKENLCHDLDVMGGKLKETQKAHDCWRETSYIFSDKHKEMVEFINSVVPDFIDTFEKAERKMSMINTPQEVEVFSVLCRKMVNKWNLVSKIG